jgi:hypothetical protein
MVTAPTPAEAAVTTPAHVWNWAEGNSQYSGNYYTKMDVALYITVSENPFFIAYNEICEFEFTSLQNAFTAYGRPLRGRFKATRSSASGCDTFAIGNAVFGSHTLVGPPIYKEMLPYDGVERRYAVCNKYDGLFMIYTGCSVHLSPSRPTAAQQLAFAFDWWVDVHTTPWVFGGDFNQVYDYGGSPAPTAEWYFTHEEIHLPTPTITWNPGSEKIDYIYGDRGAFDDGPYNSCYNTSLSDHRYCLGRFLR